MLTDKYQSCCKTKIDIDLLNFRRLSVLRENFRTKKLKCLKFDIPLMALTATATIQVREEILESLHMSEARIVLTSFFRPNLRFSVSSVFLYLMYTDYALSL